MKKTLIAFAALSAIAGMAQAQSSVTLYGLVDAFVGATQTETTGVGATPKVKQAVVNIAVTLQQFFKPFTNLCERSGHGV